VRAYPLSLYVVDGPTYHRFGPSGETFQRGVADRGHGEAVQLDQDEWDGHPADEIGRGEGTLILARVEVETDARWWLLNLLPVALRTTADAAHHCDHLSDAQHVANCDVNCLLKLAPELDEPA
jgi:hypothetical protein